MIVPASFPADVRIIRTYIVEKKAIYRNIRGKSIYRKIRGKNLFIEKSAEKQIRGNPWNTNALISPM